MQIYCCKVCMTRPNSAASCHQQVIAAVHTWNHDMGMCLMVHGMCVSELVAMNMTMHGRTMHLYLKAMLPGPSVTATTLFWVASSRLHFLHLYSMPCAYRLHQTIDSLSRQWHTPAFTPRCAAVCFSSWHRNSHHTATSGELLPTAYLEDILCLSCSG